MDDEFEEIELDQQDYDVAVQFLEEIGLIEMYGMGEDGEVSYALSPTGLAAFAATIISREHWLSVGYVRGYCGPPVCVIHDGYPSTEQEDGDFEDGYDPCIDMVRLYPDEATKKAVEANHAASVWRANRDVWPSK